MPPMRMIKATRANSIQLQVDFFTSAYFTSSTIYKLQVNLHNRSPHDFSLGKIKNFSKQRLVAMSKKNFFDRHECGKNKLERLSLSKIIKNFFDRHECGKNKLERLSLSKNFSLILYLQAQLETLTLEDTLGQPPVCMPSVSASFYGKTPQLIQPEIKKVYIISTVAPLFTFMNNVNINSKKGFG